MSAYLCTRFPEGRRSGRAGDAEGHAPGLAGFGMFPYICSPAGGRD